ncbi:RTF1 [Candida oxycetoniae]|uniref:RTF1 n=1 Tax=Candida oxycetoniae TaxID=497107 RepID=A0AAI9T1U7_9ASCO|nr:RTF1 [Candida oxycetoniae]KAI3406510.2 RTF1 [Candida oxycetoniae]
MSDLEDDLLALAEGDDYESEVELSTSKRHATQGDSESEEDTVLTKRRRMEFDDEEVEGHVYHDDSEAGKGEIGGSGDYDSDAGYEPEEDAELVNPYPLEGKYKDEKDREELEEMDEIKREEILFERSQEMDKYNERNFLQQRIKQQEKQQRIKQQGEKLRTSSRNKTAGVKLDKEHKLSELKKQREKHSRRRRTKSEYGEGSEGEEEEQEEEQEEESEEIISDDEDYSDLDKPVSWGGISKSKHAKSTEVGKFEDVNRIRVGRSLLTQYCYHTGFEEAVTDTYAKISVGMDKETKRPIYRMVKICDIRSRPERPYRIGNAKYDLEFLVSQNKHQKKVFPMNVFSDSPITREEFEKYLQQLEKTGEKFDLLDDINEKFNQLDSLYNTGLTDKDVNNRIARKQQMQQAKGSYTAFEAVQAKSKLMEELKIYKQEGNLKETQRIIQELKSIDEILDQQTSSSIPQSQNQSIAKVNERNRKLNSTNIRKAELKTKNNSTVAGAAGAAGGAAGNLGDYISGDPFSRLKTNTRMFYQDLINQENAKALKSINMKELIEEKSKQETEIAKSTYRNLSEMDKLIRSIDFDFELAV